MLTYNEKSYDIDKKQFFENLEKRSSHANFLLIRQTKWDSTLD